MAGSSRLYQDGQVKVKPGFNPFRHGLLQNAARNLAGIFDITV
jgi:hypothetical protein